VILSGKRKKAFADYEREKVEILKRGEKYSHSGTMVPRSVMKCELNLSQRNIEAIFSLGRERGFGFLKGGKTEAHLLPPILVRCQT